MTYRNEEKAAECKQFLLWFADFLNGLNPNPVNVQLIRDMADRIVDEYIQQMYPTEK